MTTKIFFDLEFTDLKSTALLISAGFVDEQNNALYVEIEAPYWQAEASPFVTDVVKPLLSGDGLPGDRATARMGGWLNARGPELLLISDSDWDLRILRRHFKLTGYIWPAQWRWDSVLTGLNGRQRNTLDSTYTEWFLRSGRKQHHALNDASALWDAYRSAINADE